MALLLAPVLALQRPFYETADDWIMAFIAAGRVVADQPSSHLLYTHVWIGQILMQLYRGWPGLPWYPLYDLAALFVAFTVIVYAAVGRRWSPLRGAAGAAFLLLAAWPDVLGLQFTRVAYWLALSGLALVWTSPFRSATGRYGRAGELVAAISLCVAGSMVRIESLGLALVVGLPVFAIDLARHRDQRLRLAAFAIATVALATMLYRLDRDSYRADPAWSGYPEHVGLAARVLTSGSQVATDRAIEAAGRAGWSPQDLAMFHTWFFTDPDLYGSQRLATVVAALPAYRVDLSPGLILSRITAVLSHPRNLVLLLTTLGFLLLGGIRRDGVVKVLLTTAWILVLVVCMAVFTKLPARVHSSMITTVALLAVLYARNGWPRTGAASLRQRLAWGRPALLGGIGGLVLISTLTLISRNQTDQRLAGQLEVALSTLAGRPGEHFLSWGSGFPYERMPAFHEPCAACQGLELSQLGTLTLTPIFRDRLDRLGVTDLYSALYQRPDLYLIIDTRQVAANERLYHQFMCQHHGVDTAFETRYGDERMTVVQVVPDLHGSVPDCPNGRSSVQ